MAETGALSTSRSRSPRRSHSRDASRSRGRSQGGSRPRYDDYRSRSRYDDRRSRSRYDDRRSGSRHDDRRYDDRRSGSRYDDGRGYHRRGRGHYDDRYQGHTWSGSRGRYDRGRSPPRHGHRPPSPARPRSRSPPGRAAPETKVDVGSSVAQLLKQLGGGSVAAAAAGAFGGVSGAASGSASQAVSALVSSAPSTSSTDASDPMAAVARAAALVSQAAVPANDKIARELYIGNLPAGILPAQVKEFFTSAMAAIGAASGPGDPISAVRYEANQRFCFIEFRGPKEAEAATALNGIMLYGNALKVGRPKAYLQMAASLAPPATSSNATELGSGAADTVAALAALAGGAGGAGERAADPVLRVSNLKDDFGPEAVRQVLEPFGKVVSCEAVEAAGSEVPGVVQARLEDPSLHEVVADQLQGLDMGGRPLCIKATELGADGQPQGEEAAGPKPAVQLGGILTLDMLSDGEEVQEVLGEVQEECAGFGTVKGVTLGTPDEAGVPIFVCFADEAAADKCAAAMKGRKFDERSIVATCITEAQYNEAAAPAPSQEDAAPASSTTATAAVESGDAEEAPAAVPEGAVLNLPPPPPADADLD